MQQNPKLSDQDYDFQFKIILIGNSGVGKSNFLSRYIHGIFNLNSKTTIGIEFGSKVVDYANSRIQIQLWDTLGQDRYKKISKLYYRGAVGCLLLFDLSSRPSFESVEELLEGVRENLEGSAKILLCGNKKDLERQVTTEEARSLAEKESLGYIEISVKDNINVNEAMQMMIKQISQDMESQTMKKQVQDDNFKLKQNTKAEKQQKSCC